MPRRQSRLGEPVAARLLHRERDAEVRQHRLALVQQDVLRLDVAVHHALPVRVVERARHLPRDGERLVQPELLLAIQLVPQRLAADVRQDVPEEALGLPRVDQREDVRMIEPRRDLDLGEEALRAQHGAQLGPQHLERHLAVVLDVAREVDRGHAARAELALDGVAARQGRGQTSGIAQG